MFEAQQKVAEAHDTLRESTRAWMQATLDRTGWSAQQWADKAGVAATTITRFMGDPNAPLPTMRTAFKLLQVANPGRQPANIEKVLQDMGPLADVALNQPLAFLVPSENDDGAVVDDISRRSKDDMMPVLAAARGGPDQEMFVEDGPMDHITRPSALHGVRNAYGIYFTGESMAPMYRPGQILHVNPHRRPKPGRGIVIWKMNGALLVKEFLRQTTAGLTVVEYQPERREFVIPQKDIKYVHLIVGLDDD